MNDFPLVSVLIPAYNHEKFISSTIYSIIQQTYKNIELIVIDDGSTDSTWNVLLGLKTVCEKRFVRVDFQTQGNAGTCITLNRLLEKSRGDFICIVASDDCMAHQACERMISFFSDHPDYMLVVGDNEIIDAEGKKAYWDRNRNLVYNREKANFFTVADFWQHLTGINFSSEEFGSYQKLFFTNHVPNGYMIRKSIFDKIRGFTTEAPLEDWYLMLQIAKYGKMKFLNEVLFFYRWHEGNTVKNKEKMNKLTNKTREYEKKILSEIDISSVLNNVKNFIINGYEYKRKSFLYIFDIVYIMTVKCRVKEIRILNKTLFKINKY